MQEAPVLLGRAASAPSFPAAQEGQAKALVPAEKAKGGVGDAMSLEDGVVGGKGTMCVISFPGKYQAEWNHMVGLVKLLQALEKGKETSENDEVFEGVFSTACIFLPDGDERFGKHARNERDGDECYCLKLYGEQKDWGCQWFAEWDRQLTKAKELGQDLVVVYKEGEVGQGDDGRWGELSSFTTNAKGLGGSQRGEVAWAKARGIEFRKMDVAELTLETAMKMHRSLEEHICGGSGLVAAELLADAIGTCAEAQRGLQRLHVSLPLGDDGVQALAPVLPGLQNLTQLGFGTNPLREAGLRAVASALPKLPKLEALVLVLEVDDDVFSQALAPVLPNLTSLKHLSFWTDSIAEAGFRSLATVPNLESLALLGGACFEALAPVLPSLPNLRHLEIYEAHGDWARLLAEVLPQLSNLQTLHLPEANDAVAQALAPALPGLSKLRELHFRRFVGTIGEAGIQAFPELQVVPELLSLQVPELPSLQVLDLGLGPINLEPLRREADVRTADGAN